MSLRSRVAVVRPGTAATRIKRLLAAAVVALAGCTPSELRAWQAWHDADPDAAVAFAQQPDVIADLATGEHESDGPQFAQYLAEEPTPGDCASYAPLLARHGLPVATFTRIAWRESGCRHDLFTNNRTDLGGGLLGINLRAGAARWLSWCGLTTANVTDADTNIRCAAAAYRRMGMAPWQ